MIGRGQFLSGRVIRGAYVVRLDTDLSASVGRGLLLMPATGHPGCSPRGLTALRDATRSGDQSPVQGMTPHTSHGLEQGRHIAFLPS
jgi:hypothetical protein